MPLGGRRELKNTINLFMWGYQPHFRFAILNRARTVLELIAPGLRVDVFLVGVRTPEATDGHPVCVEPEDGDWDPSLFFACASRADAIFADHPGHNIMYGDEPSTRDKPENIRRASVMQAVKEVLDAYDAAHGKVSYCWRPVRVHRHHVVPVFQLAADDVAKYPRIPARLELDQFDAPVGFLESAIECLLREATAALEGPDPGRFIGSMRRDSQAILREAGDRFCDNVALTTGDILFQGVFDAVNVVSSLLYEGSTAVGEIAFVRATAAGIQTDVRLKRPVPLHRQKLARKLVEMTGSGLACLCHGSQGLVGLGRCQTPAQEPQLRVKFSGHYRWELYYHERLLMQTAFGIPRLPTVRLSADLFKSNARRVFLGIREDKLELLWSIVSAAMDQEHGTMIVFSEAASSEATRLSTEAIPIDPVSLTPHLVRKLTGIDGALLADTDGVCHAIGVILDGLATPAGDASRGARYNSAIRYLSAASAPTMCLVVSEDGYVNIFPELRPQIKKSDIEAWVQKLRTQDIDTYFSTRDWLDEHRFYLTSAQCQVVNAELERIHSAPPQVGEIRLSMDPFSAHPAMNDSYYLVE